MTLDVEQIKQDMEAGTPGPWGLNGTLIFSIFSRTSVCKVWRVFSGEKELTEVNARRIARVPDLEAAFLAQAAEIAALKAQVARYEVALMQADQLSDVATKVEDGWPHKPGWLKIAVDAYKTARAALSAEGEE